MDLGFTLEEAEKFLTGAYPEPVRTRADVDAREALSRERDAVRFPIRAQSADLNRRDSGLSCEDFEIAKSEAKFAMGRRPNGMTFDDLLNVGIDVITNEAKDKGGLHGPQLRVAIRRRIDTRAIPNRNRDNFRWSQLEGERAPDAEE